MNLSEATAQYWEVMRAYNEQERCQVVSIERALDMLSEVLAVIGPHHPLAVKVTKLQASIIIGTGDRYEEEEED